MCWSSHVLKEKHSRNVEQRTRHELRKGTVKQDKGTNASALGKHMPYVNQTHRVHPRVNPELQLISTPLYIDFTLWYT